MALRLETTRIAVPVSASGTATVVLENYVSNTLQNAEVIIWNDSVGSITTTLTRVYADSTYSKSVAEAGTAVVASGNRVISDIKHLDADSSSTQRVTHRVTISNAVATAINVLITVRGSYWNALSEASATYNET